MNHLHRIIKTVILLLILLLFAQSAGAIDVKQLMSRYYANPGPPREDLLLWAKNATDTIGISTRTIHPLQYIQADGAGYFSNSMLSGAETVVSSEGTATITPASGKLDVSAGTLWNFELSNGSRYDFCSQQGDTKGKVYDLSGNDFHLSADGFGDMDALCTSGLTSGSDTLNQDGWSDRENLVNSAFVSDSEYTSSIDSNGFLVLTTKTTANGSLSVFGTVSTLRPLAESTTYIFRASFLALDGQEGTGRVVDLGWHTGAWTGMSGEVISGPGSVSNNGYMRISSLSETVPTIVEITKNDFVVGNSMGTFFSWPAGAANSEIGYGCKIKDYQVCEGTVKDLGEYSTSGIQPKRDVGIPYTRKIAYLGDSQFVFFPEDIGEKYSHLDIVEAGVSGDTTAQMLARINADVIVESPDICVIEAAANDRIQSQTAAYTLGNLADMVDMCVAAGITPVISNSSPLGASAGWTAGHQTLLEEVNSGLVAYCALNGITLIDTYSAFKNPSNTELASYFDNGDGTHYNTAGTARAVNLFTSTLPMSFAQSDTTLYPLKYQGRAKYNLVVVSGTGPSDWVVTLPAAPELIEAIGLDNAYYDASGVPQNINYTTLMALEGDQLWGSEERVEFAVYQEDLTGINLLRAQRYFNVTP